MQHSPIRLLPRPVVRPPVDSQHRWPSTRHQHQSPYPNPDNFRVPNAIISRIGRRWVCIRGEGQIPLISSKSTHANPITAIFRLRSEANTTGMLFERSSILSSLLSYRKHSCRGRPEMDQKIVTRCFHPELDSKITSAMGSRTRSVGQFTAVCEWWSRYGGTRFNLRTHFIIFIAGIIAFCFTHFFTNNAIFDSILHITIEWFEWTSVSPQTPENGVVLLRMDSSSPKSHSDDKKFSVAAITVRSRLNSPSRLEHVDPIISFKPTESETLHKHRKFLHFNSCHK